MITDPHPVVTALCLVAAALGCIGLALLALRFKTAGTWVIRSVAIVMFVAFGAMFLIALLQ